MNNTSIDICSYEFVKSFKCFFILVGSREFKTTVWDFCQNFSDFVRIDAPMYFLEVATPKTAPNITKICFKRIDKKGWTNNKVEKKLDEKEVGQKRLGRSNHGHQLLTLSCVSLIDKRSGVSTSHHPHI